MVRRASCSFCIRQRGPCARRCAMAWPSRSMFASNTQRPTDSSPLSTSRTAPGTACTRRMGRLATSRTRTPQRASPSNSCTRTLSLSSTSRAALRRSCSPRRNAASAPCHTAHTSHSWRPTSCGFSFVRTAVLSKTSTGPRAASFAPTTGGRCMAGPRCRQAWHAPCVSVTSTSSSLRTATVCWCRTERRRRTRRWARGG
mmetsp:Transcript_4379/g.11027  ORF Transcript_4379/g.11027 Transcript_4379/m.11027 type:complete len:200 (+) Transcript_4379:251-850(+)